MEKSPSSLGQNSEDHPETTKVRSGPRTGTGRRSSSRIDRLSKPLERLAKPSIRLKAAFREADQLIPWSKRGPHVANKKKQEVPPPPPPPRTVTTTGVSRAALKYEASDHIKRLAKHRSIPKVDDRENGPKLMKPLSHSIKKLSKPRP